MKRLPSYYVPNGTAKVNVEENVDPFQLHMQLSWTSSFAECFDSPKVVIGN